VGKIVGKNRRFYLKDSNIRMIENLRKKGESLKDAGEGIRFQKSVFQTVP